jgi:hypothetical protein
VENALISKCSNAIITAWLEQRDVVLEEINTLASEIERSDLRVSFDSNETIIKEGVNLFQHHISLFKPGSDDCVGTF